MFASPAQGISDEVDPESAAPLLVEQHHRHGDDAEAEEGIGSDRKVILRTFGVYLAVVLACFGLLGLLGEHVLSGTGHTPSPAMMKKMSAAMSPGLVEAGRLPSPATFHPPEHAYVVDAPVNLTTLRNVYQVGNPRSASTYQWYLLCSILRVVIDDGREVRCDENDDKFWWSPGPGQPDVVRLFKVHPSADDDATGKTTEANRLPRVKGQGGPLTPNTDVVFVSLRPDEGTNAASILSLFQDQRFNLAYKQVYDDFVAAGIGDLGNYVPLFNLTEQQVKLLWEHMRYYGIIRKCCGVQALSLIHI